MWLSSNSKKCLWFRYLSQSIINGFNTCGLHPFDPNAVNSDILNKKKKKSSKEYQDNRDEDLIDSLQESNPENEELLSIVEKKLYSSFNLAKVSIARSRGWVE